MNDPFFINNGKSSAKRKRITNNTNKQQDPKRARPSNNNNKQGRNALKKHQQHSDSEDEDKLFAGAEGIDDMDLEGSDHGANGSEEEEEGDNARESAAEKRLRLAKQYLSKLADEMETGDGEDEGDIDAAEIDRDLIAERLRIDVLEQENKVFHKIADQYANLQLDPTTSIRTLKGGSKGHQLPVTSVSVALYKQPGKNKSKKSPVTPYIYSTSKDGSIIKWDFFTGKRLHTVPGGLKVTRKLKKLLNGKVPVYTGHSDQVLCSATSHDGKFIATGGADKLIHVWSVEDNSHLGMFRQHRDAVSGLAFRQGTNQLYSSSFDRTIKLWNVDEMSYIETLFGHQDSITALDTLVRERCVSSGARDRTIRLWKIVEESQLVYRGGGQGDYGDDKIKTEGLGRQAAGADKKTQEAIAKKKKIAGAFGGSMDAVALMDEENWISGSDGGAISLWNINKKKPVYTRLRAHGKGTQSLAVSEDKETNSDASQSSTYCNWIISLTCVRYSDVFASGSCDGQVRLWKLAGDKKSFSLLTAIPIIGFINQLSFFYGPEWKKEAGNVEEEIETLNEDLDNEDKTVTNKPGKKLYLAVAVGQEHRLGRWWRMKKNEGVKNCVKIVCLG